MRPLSGHSLSGSTGYTQRCRVDATACGGCLRFARILRLAMCRPWPHLRPRQLKPQEDSLPGLTEPELIGRGLIGRKLIGGALAACVVLAAGSAIAEEVGK